MAVSKLCYYSVRYIHTFLVTPLFYDQPEYDIFWQTLSDLNVPLYLHPRNDVPEILNFLYGHARFLIGPVQSFAATLSGHILGYVICHNHTCTCIYPGHSE